MMILMNSNNAMMIIQSYKHMQTLEKDELFSDGIMTEWSLVF
jgi:hypothetical protein